MRPRVPLNAIRAFEAAARRGSIAQAAEELHVTPTAVSHQVRTLEDFLQVKLFVRHNSAIEMTPAASNVLAKLSGGLDLISEAIRTLTDEPEARETVTLGTSVSLGTTWLLPRMDSFLTDHPDIDMSVRTYLTREEIESNETDFWISTWQPTLDRRIEPLFSEDLVPVCSPKLLERIHDTHGTRPEDVLMQVPLIHVDRQVKLARPSRPEWQRYLQEFGVNRTNVNHGLRFNQTSAAIEAAKASIGAILGRTLLIRDALARGELVPIAEAYPQKMPYYLVSSWQSQGTVAAEFKDWLIAQAA
ncbi:LysR substrate-binding domain-containing protein [Allosediminivita pacifica]|uniref:LysR family transcriptional regulator n=1 Tax=Allosediminivita pacifica TaxID=1267769 RepID=A0A2T6ANJ8_9RHOB|nr:LysR substrate-binding domain-containing protein [Allosediminivita pacifica]PTX45388.1 LysR family transcriptional regulator [Allosediminivita pacifica]GGB20890.1 transcriptional regulator [Allosediminivita pacifica]